MSFNKNIFKILIVFTLVISIGYISLYVRASNIVIYGDFYSSYSSADLYSGNRFTQAEAEIDQVVTSHVTIDAEDQLVANNPYFKLYANFENGILKLENIETGYIYASAVVDIEQTDGNQMYRDFLTSTVTIDYHQYDSRNEQFTFGSTNQQAITSVSSTKITEGDNEITICEVEQSSEVNLEITKITNGVSFDIEFLKQRGAPTVEPADASIKLKVNFTLTDQGVTAEVPVDSIVENERYLAYVYIMPLFGATREDVTSGYILVPDGPGALVRYDTTNTASQITKKFYSYDYGLSSQLIDETLTPSKDLTAAMFGKVNGLNQNGFISTVDSGSATGELVISPYGAINLKLNFTYIRYKFNATFQIYNAFLASEEQLGNTDIIQSFIPVSNEKANYVGMAEEYNDYLVKNNFLPKESTNSYKPRIELINSENIPGLFSPKNEVLTTIEDADNILSSLNADQYSVILKGWNEDGLSGKTPYDIDLNGGVGSKNEFKAFIEKYNEVYFYNDYVKLYEDGDASWFSDAAKGYNRIKMSLTDKNNELFPDYGYLYPEKTASLAKSNVKDYNKNNITGLALDGISNTLFSSYDGENNDRNYAVDKYEETVEYFSDFNIGMYAPNDYMWKYTDAYFDMPMYNNQYSYYTDTVPFLPYVLKDNMDLYSTHVNFFANSNEQVLRLIDFNLMPSYVFTESSTRALKYTDSNELFSTEFSLWKDNVNDLNDRISPVFNNTAGSKVETRTVLSNGVVELKYDNGVVVVINYLTEPFVYGTTTIAPQDFIMSGGK